MATEGVKRRLSAILSADVVGYSKLMEADEETTVRTIESYRKTVSSLIEQHDGRVIDSPGDNILSEFASVVDAVQCAVEIQHVIRAKNAVVPEARRMEFRIGISLEDVIEEKDRIYGDGVNIASRIEGLADAGGICISGRAYDHIANKLALGYEDIGEHPVKNISVPVQVYRIPMDSAVRDAGIKKNGLRRFQWPTLALCAVLISVGSVTVWNRYLKPSIPAEVAKSGRVAVPAKGTESAAAEQPSIAVLPFDNMSNDPEQEYFVDGMTEEITSRLSRSSDLLVIARNSAFAYKGKAVKVQQVGEELGAEYVLEGSVRKPGERIRITAQLIDAVTGNHLWAETYDREMKDVFALQDDIAERIAVSLVAENRAVEIARARQIPSGNLTAYDSVMRGLDHFRRGTMEENESAREYFSKAVELDAQYAQAYALLGNTYTTEFILRGNLDAVDRALELAEKALSIDDSLPDAYGLLAWVYSAKGDFRLAVDATQRAISLDPNNADFYASLAHHLVDARRPQEAIDVLERAIRLNPKYPVGYTEAKSRAYLYMDRYWDAIAAMKEVLSRKPDSAVAHIHLCYDYRWLWILQQTDDPQVLDLALEMGKRAVALDETSQWAQWNLTHSYLLKKQYEQALSNAERSIELIPDGHTVINVMGEVLLALGRYQDAIEIYQKTVGRGTASTGLGVAYRLTGQRPKAEQTLKQSAFASGTIPSDETFPRIQLAILYSDMDRGEDARAEARRIEQLWPKFSVEKWGARSYMKDRDQVERDMAALRMAGLK